MDQNRCGTTAARQARAPQAIGWQTALTVHRAEQDSGARLSARRDDGPALVRRGGVSAADGRTADAGDRPDAERGAGVVDRSRRHAAVDARRAQRRHLGRAAQGLRRGRHPGVRSASRRRHRVVHAVSRCAVWRWSRGGQIAAAGGRHHRRRVRAASIRCRPDSVIAFTPAIRGRRGCSRWRSSSSSKASTSG